MSKVQYYQLPVSTASRVVTWFIAAEELGDKIEFKDTDILKGAHKTKEFKKINPKQLIPVIVDGDFKLTEAVAIVQYLADKFKKNNYYPTDLKQRAKVNEALVSSTLLVS